MKTKIFVLLTVSIITFSTSCKQDAYQQEYEQNTNCDFVLNKERIALIDSLCDIYDEEFKSTLYRLKKNNIKFNPEKFVSDVNESINNRISEKALYQKTKKSENIIPVDSVNVNLSVYLNRLSDLIFRTNCKDTDNKQTTIINYNRTIENYIKEIELIDSLNNYEKQFVIENIVIKKNLLITVLNYGETIYDNSIDNYNFKGQNKKCGWYCQNQHWIACTVATIAATAVCGIDVASYISGNIALGVVLTVACGEMIAEAIKCWSS
jgi:hypothetical protein